MRLDTLLRIVTRRPLPVIGTWLAAAVVVGSLAPSLTRLAAEGQDQLLPKSMESVRAAAAIARAWPDQSYDSLVVTGVYRPSGLTADDHAFALRLADRLERGDHPKNIRRVVGPRARRELAERLVSRDRTLQLVLTELSTSLVSPTTQKTIAWLERQAKDPALRQPAGLRVFWSGDAVIGGEYMRKVQTSLDRAAMVTVVLLLIVLLAVYRSIWLALVPLVTIGTCLIIARGLLAWMVQAGWEVSSLVELFLVVVLFGSGTDFCLFLSWRFGEHWNAANPGGAMRVTLRRALAALLTSAGTVIVSLSLMGTTKFKLFSSTGPSVALGLALTVAASLTLTPALLVLLARHHPRAFAGLTAPASGFWDVVGRRVLQSPVVSWLGTIAVMAPLAYLGMRTVFVQDLLAELPGSTPSIQSLRLISRKFDPGAVAPLTVVLSADHDLRDSQGLALIDDVSRFLDHQRVAEVRSATQPLGSPEPFNPARLSSRLDEVNHGFDRMLAGAKQLRDGLNEGVAKLRAAIWLEDVTGLALTGAKPGRGESRSGPQARGESRPGPKSATEPHRQPEGHESLLSGLKQATAALMGTGRNSSGSESESRPSRTASPSTPRSDDPRMQMVEQLTRAADGAGQIADGAARAQQEVSLILKDPVGQRALNRLLIRPDTVREHPEILQSFAAYISSDGRLARIDVTQRHRIFSGEAIRQVQTLRRRLHEYLGEAEDLPAEAIFAGANAGAADVEELTQADQQRAWVIVPVAVFLVLLITLRDLGACLNLVATMVLTYAFALGVTHLLFVTILGAEGLDWKVPYFLFVLLVAVGVDYNVFLMTRLQEEAEALGLRAGINRAIAQTGGLISSAAAITACSFASFLFSPLSSLRQLGFALVVGITIDALLVRPLLVPCGHWLMNRHLDRRLARTAPRQPLPQLARVSD